MPTNLKQNEDEEFCIDFDVAPDGVLHEGRRGKGSSLYGVSKSNGTIIFDGYGATDATVSSGSSVSLSSYSGGASGGGGFPVGWH